MDKVTASGFLTGVAVALIGVASYNRAMDAPILRQPTKPAVVAMPNPTTITFTNTNVVEFEDGGCWIVANTKKRSMYRYCQK